MKLLTLLFFASTLLYEGNSENILALYPMSSRSHKIIIESTLERLAKRNHSITVVSSFKTPTDHPNIRDIVVMKGFDPFSEINLVGVRKLSLRTFLEGNPAGPVLRGCHITYQNPEFMQLLNQTFDLIFIDTFLNNCLHGFMYRLKAPVIRTSPLPAIAEMAMQLGNYMPPSFVPDPYLPLGDEMNLAERILNFVAAKPLWLYYYYYYPHYEKIYRHYLGDDIPGLWELESNISMVLQNSHVTMNHPRPSMPDIVDIGGVHCRPARPLPQDLEEFISGSKDGIIVFSLGTIFMGHHMPEEARKIIVNAFSKLKQRVLWKWDLNHMTDLPPNVRLYKWLPLQDVLGHPNTKLFVTHGGLLSTQEAIYHEVPFVGIPLFFDQDLNMKRYVEEGIATSLEILDLKEEDVLKAIETVLNNPEYKQNVKKMSRLFRDNQMAPIDTAVFWSEYVMRHKGALHLRSAARKLNFIEYHSIDVIAILFTIILALLSFIIFVIWKLYRKLLRRILESNFKRGETVVAFTEKKWQ